MELKHSPSLLFLPLWASVQACRDPVAMDLALQNNEPKVNPSFFEVVLVDIVSQLLGKTGERF